MSDTILLRGGPADGFERTGIELHPGAAGAPSEIRVLVERSTEYWITAGENVPPIPVAIYRPLLADDGLRSRDDAGRIVYAWFGMLPQIPGDWS